MKKIILGLLFCLAINKLFGQFTEERMIELENKIAKQEKQIQNLNQNMINHADEYYFGFKLIASSIVCTSLYTLSGYYEITENENPIPVYGIFSIIGITGIIFQIHSHKYFKFGDKSEQEYLEY